MGKNLHNNFFHKQAIKNQSGHCSRVFLVGTHEGYVLLKKVKEQSQQIVECIDYIHGSNKPTNSLLRHAELCIQHSEGYFEQQSV